jgi:hypothetical protein
VSSVLGTEESFSLSSPRLGGGVAAPVMVRCGIGPVRRGG